MKKKCITLFVFLFFLYLIRFPKEALSASRTGLMLWFQTMLPTLLPFMIAANLMIQLNLMEDLTSFLSPILRHIFRISKNGCFALLMGFVCGYPMGAKVCGDLVRQKRISKEEGQYLLNFCNHASPAYMIGYVLSDSLSLTGSLFPFLLCIYIPPLLFGIISRYLCFPKEFKEGEPGPAKQAGLPFFMNSVEASMSNGFLNITKLGGYMILFSIISSMFTIFPLSSFCKDLFSLLMEITNGTAAMATHKDYFPLTVLLILSGNAFGGFSCMAQTKSMIGGTNLSFLPYICSKGVIAILTGVFTFLLLF